ncbi:aspartate dehydrogenase [Ensifer soli]|uniref:aspartate dehydrogenase n=1 Tax=Ciceribacter sp. sgz301302 TaxID=3342379 RepID=UPI0035B9D891
MATTRGLHLGMIGFGAIARDVHRHFSRRAGFRFTALLRPESRARLPDDVTRVDGAGALVAAGADLVAEMAGHSAVAADVPALLAAGLPVLICSTGALADPAVVEAIETARHSGGTRLILPHGAIGGLDYLATIALVPDAEATYVSRKPPAAWRAELAALGHDPEALAAPVILFEGSPAEAARLYPKNLNAALTAARAIGPARLTVRVVADPQSAGNTHEIEAKSAAGTAFFRFLNTPSPDNPKTSMLTALSVIAAIEAFAGAAR